MFQLPNSIAQQFVAVTTEQRSPVLLKVTSEGQLLSWEGALAEYGLTQLQPRVPIGQQLFFLEGLFPLAQERDSLPCIQTPGGLVVDIHLFREAHQSWILLLDASAQAARITRQQQKGNELNLLRHQYEQLLEQSLQQHERQSARPGFLSNQSSLEPSLSEQRCPEQPCPEQPCPEQPCPEQPCRGTCSPSASCQAAALPSMSVLLIKRCRSPAAPSLSPSQTPTFLPSEDRAQFRSSLPVITQIVVEEGGLINHILGEMAIALFGLLPSEQSSACQALHAAHRLLDKFNNPNGNESGGLGMGIVTGQGGDRAIQGPIPALISELTPGNSLGPPQGYNILPFLGYSLHRAMALQPHLQTQQILIDPATFSALGEAQVGFTPISSSSLGGSADRLYQQWLHS